MAMLDNIKRILGEYADRRFILVFLLGLIVGALVVHPPYRISSGGANKVYRVNTWTGSVSVCIIGAGGCFPLSYNKKEIGDALKKRRK